MKLLSIVQRISRRIPRRHKAEDPLPVVSWQELEESEQAELLDQVKEDATEDIIALQNALRGRN